MNNEQLSVLFYCVKNLMNYYYYSFENIYELKI